MRRCSAEFGKGRRVICEGRISEGVQTDGNRERGVIDDGENGILVCPLSVNRCE